MSVTYAGGRGKEKEKWCPENELGNFQPTYKLK